MPVFSIASPWSDLKPQPPGGRSSRGGGADARVRCGIGKATPAGLQARRQAWEGACCGVPEQRAALLAGAWGGKVASSAPSLEDASAMARGIGARGAPSDLFALLAPYAQRAYVSTFASVARELGVYMISGSMILSYEAGGVTGLQNMGWCFGPDGSRVARYVKCHLMPMEAQWDLKPGTSLAAFSLGGVGYVSAWTPRIRDLQGGAGSQGRHRGSARGPARSLITCEPPCG